MTISCSCPYHGLTSFFRMASSWLLSSSLLSSSIVGDYRFSRCNGVRPQQSRRRRVAPVSRQARDEIPLTFLCHSLRSPDLARLHASLYPYNTHTSFPTWTNKADYFSGQCFSSIAASDCNTELRLYSKYKLSRRLFLKLLIVEYNVRSVST